VSGRGEAVPVAAAGAPSRVEGLKRWLGSRSHLYNLVSVRADELLVRLGLRRLVYPFEMEVLMSRPPAVVERAWEATGAALSGLGEMARARRLRVLVVIIPMKHQVSDRVWERVRSHYGVLSATGAAFERDRPQRIVSDLCARAGLPSLDLLAGLREEAADGTELYWPRDQHFNATGHAVAARLIARHLEREHLLTPRVEGGR